MDGQRSPDSPEASQPRQQHSEARLIDRAKRGDEQAIGELYRRHVDLIYRYVYARVQDASIAEDLTAEVFVKALEGLPGYEFTGSPIQAWLYRIAHARTVDYWRRQERRQEVELEDTVAADEPSPPELLDLEAEWVTAMNLVAQLTDDQQDVLILRFVGDLSLSEVAQTLGKTTGAVKALQHRALASLARLQEEQGAGAGHE